MLGDLFGRKWAFIGGLLGASAITLKAEYLRYDLGSRNVFVPSVGGPGVGYVSRFSTEGSLARAGINYKFGSY